MTAAQNRAYQRLLRWHWDIAARLRDEPLLAGVPVAPELPEDRTAGGQIIAHLESLAGVITGGITAFNPTGQSGLLIFVGLGESYGPTIGANKLTFQCRLKITAVESAIYNTASTGFAPNGDATDLHAEAVIAVVVENLKNFTDGGVVGLASPTEVSGDHMGYLPAALREKLPESELDRVFWGTELEALLTIPMREKVGKVTVTHNAGTITLVPPAGATAFYTVDGRYPTTAAATTYSEPFAVTPPVIVRALAKQTGKIDSDLASLEVPA